MKRVTMLATMAICLCSSALAASKTCEIPLHVRSPEGKEIERLRREQQQLLLEMRNQMQALPASTGREKLERQLAAIEKRIELEAGNACPVPDRDALEYAEEIFDRIEECGTRNFPTSKGKSVFGTVRATILIAADGSLISTTIARASGIPDLDEHAMRVVSASAPFGAVPSSVLDGRFNQIRLDAYFRFIHESQPRPIAQPKKKCSL